MARGSSSSPRSSRALLVFAALLIACLLLISIAPRCAEAAMSKKEARAEARAKKAAANAAAAAASSSSAASDQTVADDKPPAGEVLVTCGSALKLEHADTGRLLHSQNVAYGGEGSGQMGVTAVAAATDPGGVWLVKPVLLPSRSSSPPGAAADGDGDGGLELPSCRRGQPLKSGDRVRLQHARSRRWLHSHEFPSPISRQLEVSAFGGETQTDAMDEWVLELDPASNAGAGSSVFWKRDGRVSLRHVGTGGYLSSHERAFGHPIAGQNEVFGKKSGKDFWKAGEGVFFEATTAATEK